MKAFLFLACTLATLATSVVMCRAEDSDRTRFYLGLRGQDTNPLTDVHDLWGGSLGANLGKYWGVELSADAFERFVEFQGRSIAEYGILALVPQVRLRYPLLDDRLVPYVVGGVGIGLTELNDRKPAGFDLSVKEGSSALPVGTLGAGVEYFFADNMAAGVEVKYLLAGDQTLTINGTRHDQRVESLFTSLGLRLFVPELRPASLAEARDPPPTRVYLGFRAGGAISTGDEVFPEVAIDPEPPAYFSTANQFFGVALGVNLGRYYGVELAVEGYETRLTAPGLGSIGEYAIYTLSPQVRLRYPLRDGRVVPYAIGGVGLSVAEFNDRKRPAADLNIDGNSFGVATAIGVGIEYFVASNIAVGFETRYLTSRGHTLKIGTGRQQEGDLEAVVLALTLRAFIAELGRRPE